MNEKLQNHYLINNDYKSLKENFFWLNFQSRDLKTKNKRQIDIYNLWSNTLSREIEWAPIRSYGPFFDADFGDSF